MVELASSAEIKLLKGEIARGDGAEGVEIIILNPAHAFARRVKKSLLPPGVAEIAGEDRGEQIGVSADFARRGGIGDGALREGERFSIATRGDK